jgi:hypothetical protein
MVIPPSVAAKRARAGSRGAAPPCNLRSGVVAAVKRGRLGELFPCVIVRQYAKSTRLARTLKPIQQERNEYAVLKSILGPLLRIVAFV